MNISSKLVDTTTKQNHVGWLVSWSGGTPTFGRDGVMFSTFYSRSLSPNLNIEIGLHYLGGSATLPPITPDITSVYPQPLDSFRLYSTSWTSDITILFKPFSDNFSLGIGPAIQWWRRVETPLEIQIGRLHEMHTRETVALGGNLKIEYCLPMSKSMDIGIRGQIHLFLLPAETGGFDRPSTGSASLGIFVRGNW